MMTVRRTLCPDGSKHGRMRRPAIVAMTLIPFLISACGNDDDPLIAKGRDLYGSCQSCHVVDTPRNNVGPHLVGLFGRQAGSVDGFRYSDALRQSGIVWDEDSLKAFLRNPRGEVPGNRMAYAGLRNDEDLEALIAYLKQATEE